MFFGEEGIYRVIREERERRIVEVGRSGFCLLVRGLGWEEFAGSRFDSNWSDFSFWVDLFRDSFLFFGSNI